MRVPFTHTAMCPPNCFGGAITAYPSSPMMPVFPPSPTVAGHLTFPTGQRLILVGMDASVLSQIEKSNGQYRTVCGHIALCGDDPVIHVSGIL